MGEVIYFDVYPGVAGDGDLNAYSKEDLKDLTQSGIGEAGHEVVSQADFLVFLFIIIVILGLIAGIWMKFKNFGKK
jgi:hypothetical protein